MILNVFILSLELAKVSLRKHHASLRYLGKPLGGHFDPPPPGRLTVKQPRAAHGRRRALLKNFAKDIESI